MEDIDGDGDVDLITSSYFDSRISVYKNRGDGKFRYEFIISNGNHHYEDIATADLDLDGDLDLITSAGYNYLTWFENIGHGRYSNEQVLSGVSSYHNCILAADVNGDAYPDIISGTSDESINVFINNGDQTFRAPTSTWLGANPSDLCLSDLDLDGDLDLVMSFVSLDVITGWVENDGLGNWGILHVLDASASGAYTFGIFIAAADVDGDGLDDPITNSHSNTQLLWHRNLGQGVIEPGTRISESLTPKTMIEADINGDGVDDYVAMGWDVYWFEKPVPGEWIRTNRISTRPESLIAIACGDVDGDGDQDVIAGSRQSEVYLYKNLGLGEFATAELIGSQFQGLNSVASADLNSDGFDDVIATYSNNIVWYPSKGDGSFSLPQVVSQSQQNPIEVTATDIDDDSDLDLVVLGVNGSVSHYQNLGGGGFDSRVVLFRGDGYSTSFTCGDVDQDGDMDFVTLLKRPGAIYWLENLGNLNFTAHAIQTTIDTPTSVHIADLNQDGRNDLAVTIGDLYSPNAAFFLAQVNGGFGQENFLYAGWERSTNYYGGRAITSADMDGDSDLDLMVSTGSFNQIVWFENKLPGIGQLAVENWNAGRVGTISLTGATPKGRVHIAYSLKGPGPTASRFGDVLLSPPISFLPITKANRDGYAYLPVYLPHGRSGTSVWIHAYDEEAGHLSNSVNAVIQ